MAKKSSYKGKNVIITGGSSGIGFAIANEFANCGSNIFLLARDENRLIQARDRLLKEHPGLSVSFFSIDVTDEETVNKIVTEIGSEYGIDILVNNAGISHCMLLQDSAPDKFQEVMQVNYMGAVNMSHYAWPYLAASRGHIAFVNSVAGYLGIIGYSAYSASKFALTGFAECLRLEAKDCRINLTVIYPPDTDTPMLTYENKIPDTEALSKLGSVWFPEKVAAKLIRGMRRNKFEIYCGSGNKLFLLLKVILPKAYHRISDRVVYRDRRKREKLMIGQDSV